MTVISELHFSVVGSATRVIYVIYLDPTMSQDFDF
jgi:hypothetical protein